jgi:FKBP-type peptidyl-prolyl cis-trans isomerase
MRLAAEAKAKKRRKSIRNVIIVAVIALVIVGIVLITSSNNSKKGSAASTTTTTSAKTAATTACTSTTTMAVIPVADRSAAGTTGKAPTLTVPAGSPPTQLECADLIKGSGAEAVSGDTVTVEYVLGTYSTGKVVQSSWTSQPFSFTLGKGQVITGWDEGVVGMKVGGRRELIIPPSLGYGSTSPGTGIAKDDTLVFIVDLQKIG